MKGLTANKSTDGAAVSLAAAQGPGGLGVHEAGLHFTPSRLILHGDTEHSLRCYHLH